MKAIVCNKYGSPDVLKLMEVEKPPPGDNEVLIKVHATSLIREGLSRLKALGAMGCCVVGHPTYYTRFGFENITCLSMKGVPQNVFFALSFDGYTPECEVAFHPAFQV